MDPDSKSLPLVPQLHHSDLHPVISSQQSLRRRRAGPVLGLQTHLPGYPRSSASPASTSSLASPSLRAVRQYYIDHGLHTALQVGSFDYRRNLQLPGAFPRRHSILPPRGPVTPTGNFNVSIPISSSPLSTHASEAESLAESSRQILLVGVNSGELARLGSVVTRRRSILQHCNAEKIPSAYTHDRLREWGRVYLGNSNTADVFVKAVHLRKPDNVADGTSLQLDTKSRSTLTLKSKSSDGTVKTHEKNISSADENIVIRARVLPRARERKPFLIQRRFNVQELRAKLIGSKSLAESDYADSKDHTLELSPSGEPDVHVMHIRSESTPSPSRRVSRDNGTAKASSDASPLSRRDSTSSDRYIMPIHIEYALQYLPVLAALLLSGHVRRGDAIDLPLPHPEAWRETISYVYTGRGAVTIAMNKNILYLAGSVN